MSSVDDLLARARAVLRSPSTPAPTFKVMPKDVPVPQPRHRKPAGTSRDAEKFVIRFPDDMRLRIAQFANLHRRSSNSECVVGMEWWLDRQMLMETMLRATERELAQLENLRQRQEVEALDLIAQRQPETAALIEQLKAMIIPG